MTCTIEEAYFSKSLCFPEASGPLNQKYGSSWNSIVFFNPFISPNSLRSLQN